MTETFTAEQTYEFSASPDAVFRSLTDPRELVRWFLTRATLDPRAGGAFAFDWSQGYHMDGRVLRIEPGSAVTFLWRDTMPGGKVVETEASFTVRAEGGATVLELKHRNFQDAEHMAECSARWAYYLMNLKSVLDHGTDLRSPRDW